MTHEPESRTYNAKGYSVDGIPHVATNLYIPTPEQLRNFENSRSRQGQTAAQFNPYYAYVDGHDRLRDPSTDDLIQWAAHKWGIPEDWLRAAYVQESNWNSFNLGDEALVSPTWYRLYPSQARLQGRSSVFESMGLAQIKWIPDGSVGIGSEPLRWESTAFNIDYHAATVRFYYDNPEGSRARWGDSTYVACDEWNSIGAWFQPYPWGNTSQRRYVGDVQQRLKDLEWTRAPFVHWTPPSFPPGIAFK